MALTQSLEIAGEAAVKAEVAAELWPPGTPFLPANLPATPPEWSSNSDDSE